jgi:hypothetical protein
MKSHLKTTILKCFEPGFVTVFDPAPQRNRNFTALSWFLYLSHRQTPNKNTRQSLNCIIALLQLASPIKKPRQLASFILPMVWLKNASHNGYDS